MNITIDNQDYRVTRASSSTSETFFLTERKRNNAWQLFLGRAEPRVTRLFDTEEEAASAIREWHSNLKHFNGGFL